MNNQVLRQQAKLQAEDFLKNDSQYRMGFITAEQSNPITKNFSNTCKISPKDGLKLLFSVDEDMASRAEKTLLGKEYECFAEAIRKTIREGGRVIFSGCGSSGRIAMRLESSWREAFAKFPDDKLEKYTEKVGYIQTGGDYAVIRAVESFEDSIPLGREQALEWKLTEKDLLVGITATAETTSILGTAIGALEQGAMVYMIVCSDPVPLMKKMERVNRVYSNKNCKYLLLPCGPFAITGSSRMQSSTFEQLCCAIALEGALADICGNNDFKEYSYYGAAFVDMIKQLMSNKALDEVSKAVINEAEIYKQNGLITLFADDCLLDVLTDTTERAPTFMTPPFCSLDMIDAEQSWAFVKNPTCSTEDAWIKCFGRNPRCMEWSHDKYRAIGFGDEKIDKIPDISKNALSRFRIGNEVDIKRQAADLSHALWIGRISAPDDFYISAKAYKTKSQLTLEQMGMNITKTRMDIFYHLCIKLTLNALSTAVMALMGRVEGNWMTCLAMSNKKLIDRSARIVSDVCGIPYEKALEENFYSKALCEEQKLNRSPAQESIKRLKGVSH